MLKKVISGCQLGVDLAALKAARAARIPTGGYCPKGCRTTDGDRPKLIEEFGLTEMESRYYTKRTEANVKAADATLIIASNFASPGTRLTIRCCRAAGKPYHEIVPEANPDPLDWAKSLGIYGYSVLNVAGNSEQTAPGIGEWAYDFLREVFTACRGSEGSKHGM